MPKGSKRAIKTSRERFRNKFRLLPKPVWQMSEVTLSRVAYFVGILVDSEGIYLIMVKVFIVGLVLGGLCEGGITLHFFGEA